MTQDERWLAKYNEVKTFIETNHRNPYKHDPGTLQILQLAQT